MRLVPFSPKHRASFVEADARLNMWEGAVRSAKTMISLIRWLEYVERDSPPGQLHMVGKTEKTLRMNIVEPILDMVGPTRFKVNQGQGFCTYKGRKIWMIGANDQRAETKIRGATSAGIYGDQVELWPETFFAMSLSRMSIAGAKFFGTCNPDSPYHWLKKQYLDRASDLGLRRWHFELRDNTALGMEFVEALEKEYGPPGSLWYQRYILGKWVLAEGLVYPMIDLDRHVLDVLPHGAEVLDRGVAFDYGTVNPFHGLVGEVRRDPDGVQRIYITSEYRWDPEQHGGRQKTDSEFSADIRQWIGDLPYRFMYGDPSAASMLRQLYLDGWHGVGGADNSVLDGIRVVSSLLAQGRIRFHRSCIHLMEELTGYSWDPKAQERGEDAPLKRDDHGPDALRYLIMGFRRHWRRWLAWEPVRQGEEVIENA